MNKNIFNQQINDIITPILTCIGAKKIDDLSNWATPQYLYYIRDSLWFACDYEERDHYISSGLGKLNAFKYVMPYIGVIKHYDVYLKELSNQCYISTKETRKNYMSENGIITIAKTLPLIIAKYDELTNLLKNELNEKSKRAKAAISFEINNIDMLKTMTGKTDINL